MSRQEMLWTSARMLIVNIGQYLCNVLIDSNCCILKGRADSKKKLINENKKTSILVKGKLLLTILQFHVLLCIT